METTFSTCRMASPLGEILLVSDPRGTALCGLYLERQKYFPSHADHWREIPDAPIFREAVRQLREFFDGARTRFDLALAPVGTDFQREVWGAIAQIPFGETISYAELARRCGKPSAARAAGAATGRNPITIVIPCHRVVGTGGALTGYAGGLERKLKLLDLERRHERPITARSEVTDVGRFDRRRARASS